MISKGKENWFSWKVFLEQIDDLVQSLYLISFRLIPVIVSW